MRHLLPLFVASTAAAQPPAETPTAELQTARPERLFGLAINNPLMWNDADNVAISVYVRFAPKHVVRVNGARYHYAGPAEDNVINLIHHGFNTEMNVDYSGYISDLSVGWNYFPRRAFDGPNLELAALWREADTREFRGDDERYRGVNEEAVRAMVGWSWLFRDRAFVSVAIGGSTGYAKGYENNGPDTSSGHEIRAWKTDVEGNLRFGLAFGN